MMVFGFSCKEDNEGKPWPEKGPSVSISSPNHGSYSLVGETLNIKVGKTDDKGSIESVFF